MANEWTRSEIIDAISAGLSVASLLVALGFGLHEQRRANRSEFRKVRAAARVFCDLLGQVIAAGRTAGPLIVAAPAWIQAEGEVRAFFETAKPARDTVIRLQPASPQVLDLQLILNDAVSAMQVMAKIEQSINAADIKIWLDDLAADLSGACDKLKQLSKSDRL